MTIANPKLYQWTKDEYYKMAEIGLFDEKRTELIEGQVIEMSAMLSGHAAAVMLVAAALEEVLPGGFSLRIQVPLSLGPRSEPEPDVALVSGAIRDYIKAHPTHAALIVEISDSSLEYDRTVKASLYARAGIADYWIVNLNQGQLEVRRTPIPDASQRFGYGYAQTLILLPNQSVTPLAAEDGVNVADLLP